MKEGVKGNSETGLRALRRQGGKTGEKGVGSRSTKEKERDGWKK